MWFEKLTGFEETTPEKVRAQFVIEGNIIMSKANGECFQFGHLEIPTLDELKERALFIKENSSQLTLVETVGDVQELHAKTENQYALFQAASQFNLLEMVGPHIIPAQGIDRYAYDYTQGPACAIACGAGTIYRNYFVPIKDEIGQTGKYQIDCLEEIASALNNEVLSLWEMQNGYALFSQEGLLKINKILSQLTTSEWEVLKGKLKIGLQWETEVTIATEKQVVSQAYCSALPVAYSSIESIYWERFARLILEASYEATLWAALINYQKTGVNKVFLTLVGGGAFGNETAWILESLLKAISTFKNMPLQVEIISYGSSNPSVQEFIKKGF